ncbi:hypothetical protein [Roseomonas sp. CECT 9278]|uniref:hypothetical protein n=1 Tax=Roseomonas sp. CECT 9278 TaxID=2845823 RepID=UPI001E39559B|nr:hypothetical protein [Roseomonas sp. CECT 9278]CAH0169710.1 hypothetical protein ROS9278_01165 [Roseomonas sp. CECT 9278]
MSDIFRAPGKAKPHVKHTSAQVQRSVSFTDLDRFRDGFLMFLKQMNTEKAALERAQHTIITGRIAALEREVAELKARSK